MNDTGNKTGNKKGNQTVNNSLGTPLSVGIVGVRGYVGRELISLLANQSQLKVDWVSSRQLQGKPLVELLNEDENFHPASIDSFHYYHQITIGNLTAEAISQMPTDIVVLALPNGLAKDFVEKIVQNKNCKVIIDLSADYRFDDSWVYSVPEVGSNGINLAVGNSEQSDVLKISNPGCYATAMQIAIAPLLGNIKGQVNCFGISGYSGAGTKPSVNNDPENLKDNILPYGLVEHIHEKEVSYQLKQPVSFSPHVAPFFRGITMTVQIKLMQPSTEEEIFKVFADYFKQQALIKVQQTIPTIQQINHTPLCYVGGFKLSADGTRLTLVSCLDNLLKGAASQALQNIALACGIELALEPKLETLGEK
jgi:N-acetyl-gamma-glutamyl-phosphate reductase common form